jgi:4-hydroxybutyryl-CoA dehydratase / vinylacetyl-CoA-Delta-isomerase
MIQNENFMIGGAMTDVKGDRSLSPSQQQDPDMFVHVVKKDEKGVYITGAKAHQTGCINSHWIIVMPTMRLRPEDVESGYTDSTIMVLKVFLPKWIILE